MERVYESREELLQKIRELESRIAVLEAIPPGAPARTQLLDQDTFQRVITDLPAAVHSINAQGKIIAVSDEWLRLLGYSREEVIGRRSVDFLTPDSRDFALGHMLPTFFVSGAYEKVPFECVAKSGEHVPVLASAVAERDEKGAFCRSWTAITDLRGRLHGATRRVAEQQQLLSILDGIPVWIDVTAPRTGRMLFMNKYAMQTLATHNVSLPYRIFFHGAEESSAPFLSDQPDDSRTREFRWEGRNPLTGQDVIGTALFIRWFDQDIVKLTLLTDISERKKADEALAESERRFRNTIENLDEGFFETTHTGALVYFNRALPAMLCPPVGEFSSTGESACRERIEAHISEIVAKVGLPACPGSSFGWELETHDGSKRFIEASLYPVKDRRDEIVGYNGICRDITSRKRAADHLLRTERLKAIAELASGVAHNFNNLLQVVLGGVELIDLHVRLGSFSEIPQVVEQIVESSRLGVNTVRKLQEFARIRYDETGADFRVFDICQTALYAVDISEMWWKTFAEKRGIHIVVKTDLEDECVVIGAEKQLFAVFINLITNAVEAAHTHGEIMIQVKRCGHKVEIRVADDGVGIPEQSLKRVFEPFFTTKGFESTGMGLAACYGIVKRHQGTISVESAPGKGSTFIVSLPAASEAELPKHVSSETNFRVLIIDDIQPIADLLERGLKEWGLRAVAVTSAAEGLRSFAQFPFDAVVCDLSMPEMNGWEVSRLVMAMAAEKGGRKTPFILLTPPGETAPFSKQMVECGVDAVIEKPVDIGKLHSAICRMIAMRNVIAIGTEEKAPRVSSG